MRERTCEMNTQYEKLRTCILFRIRNVRSVRSAHSIVHQSSAPSSTTSSRLHDYGISPSDAQLFGEIPVTYRQRQIEMGEVQT